MIAHNRKIFHKIGPKTGNFRINIPMNFWENVESELEYQSMERKRLANEAGFDVSNIGKGIRNGNVPLADTAVRIARVLGVSVEYLVTGAGGREPQDTPLDEELRKFRRYRKLADKLDSLPENIRSPIIQMIEDINR